MEGCIRQKIAIATASNKAALKTGQLLFIGILQKTGMPANRLLPGISAWRAASGLVFQGVENGFQETN
jgi:hypothetical protein